MRFFGLKILTEKGLEEVKNKARLDGYKEGYRNGDNHKELVNREMARLLNLNIQLMADNPHRAAKARQCKV